jgi:hypothetical protein
MELNSFKTTILFNIYEFCFLTNACNSFYFDNLIYLLKIAPEIMSATSHSDLCLSNQVIEL